MKYLSLAILGGFLLLGCGPEAGGTNNFNVGVPEQVSAFLTDLNGAPLHNVTVWSTPDQMDLSVLAHVETEGCHDPLTEAEHGVCTDENGFFDLHCDGTDEVTLFLADLDGEMLPEITLVCGAPTAFLSLDVEHHHDE